MKPHEKLQKIIILAVLFTVFLGYAGFVKADENINDLKLVIDQKNEEIKKLEEEAQKYRVEIASKQQMGETLKGELGRIEKTIRQLKNDTYLTEKKIQKTELEIQETSLEIQDKEGSIAKLQKGLTGLLQVISEKDQTSMLATLLKYRAVSDFFRQFDYADLLEEKILNSLDTIRRLQKELQTQKSTAENKKKELTVLKKSINDRKKLQEDTKKKQGELLAETKNQEKKYRELLLEQERKRAALEDEIRDIEGKIQITIDPSSLPQKGTGVLGWPLPEISLGSCFKGLNELKNCITQFFGYTSFAAVGGYNGKGHNGVDFRSSPGTQVLAAEDGFIVGTGDTDSGCRRASYGKWILIRHVNNLSTLYAHLAAIAVYPGQQTRRGDYIGLSGSSGYATGPHLHFAVFATPAVKIESIRSRVCGRLMTLPISSLNGYLNPLDYL